MISCMTQLMEASGQTYQAFDGTFRGSSPAVFERRTRQSLHSPAGRATARPMIPLLLIFLFLSSVHLYYSYHDVPKLKTSYLLMYILWYDDFDLFVHDRIKPGRRYDVSVPGPYQGPRRKQDQYTVSSAIGNIEGYHEIFGDNWLNEKRTFSLIQPRSSKSLCNGREIETENNVEISYEKLGCGLILLHYPHRPVNLCEELGLGLHGFQERIPNGEKLGLHWMLLGPKWYSFGYPLNMVPDKILTLVESSIQDSQPHLNLKDETSLMSPNKCIVKFYTNTAPLALHEKAHVVPILRRVQLYGYVDGTKAMPAITRIVGTGADARQATNPDYEAWVIQD
ncbi:oxoglutarate/iron-dependent dioxygenase [Tanacetum coccineum]